MRRHGGPVGDRRGTANGGSRRETQLVDVQEQWRLVPDGTSRYIGAVDDFDRNGFLDIMRHRSEGEEPVIDRYDGDGLVESVPLPSKHPNLESSVANWRVQNASDGE